MTPSCSFPGTTAELQTTLIPEQLSQRSQQLGVLRDSLDQNPACPFERGIGIGNALVCVDERGGCLLGHESRCLEERRRKRFEAGIARDLRLGPALRLVRQVQVFQARLGLGGIDGSGQIRREPALLLDALENRLAPRIELAQICEPFVEHTQRRVIESAGGFLPVAGDERHGRLVIEQGDRGLDLADMYFSSRARRSDMDVMRVGPEGFNGSKVRGFEGARVRVRRFDGSRCDGAGSAVQGSRFEGS